MHPWLGAAASSKAQRSRHQRATQGNLYMGKFGCNMSFKMLEQIFMICILCYAAKNSHSNLSPMTCICCTVTGVLKFWTYYTWCLCIQISSAYHVEMNPSNVGNNDRYVVQEIIKEMAKNRPVGAEGQRLFKVGGVILKKVIVIEYGIVIGIWKYNHAWYVCA